MATKTVTPKELAQELGTDAKSLRKFLREFFKDHELDTPGQGGRYAITGKQAQQIRKAFNTKPARPKAPEVDETEEVEDIADEVDEVDDTTDEDVEFEDDDELVDDEG